VTLGAPQRQGRSITTALEKVISDKCRVAAEANLDLESLVQKFVTKFTKCVNDTKTLEDAQQYVKEHEQYFAL